MKIFPKILISISVAASVITIASFPVIAHAGNDHGNKVIIYFTRHAEKLTVVNEVKGQPGIYQDNCDDSVTPRCEEALNALGFKRAALLAEWLEQRGIAHKITHIFSSDKQRTRQTVEPLAKMLLDYGTELPDFDDGVPDGINQLPLAGNKANEITSNSQSVLPTVDALKYLEPGSVAVIAGHSGTLYRIFGGELTDGSGGLGIDTTQDSFSFPKKADGKVRDFGDVWKIVIRENGTAVLKWRKNLDFKRLTVTD